MLIESAVIEIMKRNELTLTYREIRMGKSLRGWWAMSNIIEQVRQELINNSDATTKESGKRFFKEEVRFYGVKTMTVSKISKEAFKSIKKLSKKEIFDLCEQLWLSGMMEESFIACNWAYALKKQYIEHDSLLFERWVNVYVTN